MNGQAPLYAAIVALIYIVTEILKAALQNWRDRQKELERAEHEKEAAEKVAAEAREVKAALAATADKTDKIVTETEKIHKAVNSGAEAQKKELDASRAEVAGLKVLLDKSNLLKADERIAGLEALVQKMVDSTVTAGLKQNGEPEAAANKIIKAVGEAADDAVTKIEKAKQ